MRVILTDSEGIRVLIEMDKVNEVWEHQEDGGSIVVLERTRFWVKETLEEILELMNGQPPALMEGKEVWPSQDLVGYGPAPTEDEINHLWNVYCKNEGGPYDNARALLAEAYRIRAVRPIQVTEEMAQVAVKTLIDCGEKLDGLIWYKDMAKAITAALAARKP